MGEVVSALVECVKYVFGIASLQDDFQWWPLIYLLVGVGGVGSPVFDA